MAAALHTVSLLALLLHAAQADVDDDVWIEHFDKESAKPFYYHSRTRETALTPPADASVRYMNSFEADPTQKKDRSSSSPSPSSGIITMAIILPIALPMLGLLLCAQIASKEGLADLLKNMKKERNRAAKRRGTKAGGTFRQRQKTSQDGKGGRSANS